EQRVASVIWWSARGIDSSLQSAGQESEAFAGFHCRTREDNAAHLLVHECGNGHGDGKVCFSRTGWPDAEDHVVLFDGLDITALIQALGLHDSFAEGALPSVFGEPA